MPQPFQSGLSPSGAREALLETLAVSRGGMHTRVAVLVVCTLPVVFLLDIPPLLIWLAALLLWDVALVRPLERNCVIPLVEHRFEDARRLRALMVLFGLSLTQGLPLAAWSTGQSFGAVVGTAWLISSSTHVFIYFSRDRLLLAAGMFPILLCAVAGPILFSGGISWASSAMSLFILLAVAAGGTFVVRADALISKAALETAGRRSAEAASQAKTRFIANMHHELRTPLNAIIGYTEMLKEGAVEAGRIADVEDHERVLESARTQLSLMTDLMVFAELQDGHVKPCLAVFDAVTVAHAAVESVRSKAAARGNTLRVDMPPHLSVCSDANKLRNCLSQLLNNAIKFTEGGTIELRGRRDGSGSAQSITFEVRDTGIGIASDQMATIFEPFTQADESATRRYDGAGLGLAIATHIARLLGGTVSAESELGRGSTFTLTMLADLSLLEDGFAATAPLGR